MAKTKTLFICQECGANYPKWQGQCRDCGAWSSIVEEVKTTLSGGSRGWKNSADDKVRVVHLGEDIKEVETARISSGIEEFNRVLGAGIVPGSYILLGGDPGIGKSTLLMQMAGGIAKNSNDVLYVSGEESVGQTAMRAQRLGVRTEKVHVASESRLEAILDLAKNKKPQVLIIDSIQTVYMSEITSAPGSVSQVRECAARLMELAKGSNITVFLIGHVTKQGNIAGPKVLEHMVDTVLSFEGDSSHQFRLLRALKNRFGATNELAVFQMENRGLAEVTNPSELFLEERGSELIGSTVFSAMEGTRPLLCEVQALTTFSPMAMPRRTALGLDANRIHLLTAVLDKHLSLDFAKSDVFVNVVGGLKISEPAADMAVAASLISSCCDQEVNPAACFFGEIGLTGEVRAASFSEDRIREASKLGFKYFCIPASNKKHLKSYKFESGQKVYWVKHVNEMASILRNLKDTTSGKARSQEERMTFEESLV